MTLDPQDFAEVGDVDKGQGCFCIFGSGMQNAGQRLRVRLCFSALCLALVSNPEIV